MGVMRDSGIGWLGTVPSHWRVLPARALFEERKQKSTTSDVHLTPSQKYGVLPQAEYMEITGNKVVLNLSGADNMRHVEAGDYVSHLRSFQGGLEHAGIPGKVSAAYTVLKPKARIDERYFKYLFKSHLYVQALQTTTDQLRDGQSIRFGQFSLIPLPCPDVEEQRAIADYLDRETAQIDAFIAKNEELIALLTERQTAAVDAILSDATTGWPEAKLGWLFMFLNGDRGSTYPSRDEFVSDGVPFINAGHLEERAVRFEAMNYVTPEKFGEMGGAKLRDGDLLFCLRGSLGKLGIFRGNGSGALASSLVALRDRRAGVNVDFFGHLLRSSRARDMIDLAQTGSAQPNLSVEQLAQFRFPVPDSITQSETVGRIEEVTLRNESAISAAKDAVRFARERRAALISAAVTGKVDLGVAA